MLQRKKWTQPIYLILPSTWEIICHILPTFILHRRENNLSYTLAQGVWQQAVTPSREVLVLSLFLHVFPLPSPMLSDEILPPCTFSLLHSPKQQYWQHYLEMVINQPMPAVSTKTHFLFQNASFSLNLLLILIKIIIKASLKFSIKIGIFSIEKAFIWLHSILPDSILFNDFFRAVVITLMLPPYLFFWKESKLWDVVPHVSEWGLCILCLLGNTNCACSHTKAFLVPFATVVSQSILLRYSNKTDVHKM